MLVGGVTKHTSYCEILGQASLCDFPLPTPILQNYASVVTATQVMLCKVEEDRKCLVFNTTTNQWQISSAQLKQKRLYSSSVTLASGPYVLGGSGGTSSSEVMRNGVLIDGPRIPMRTVLSTALAFNSSTLVIIGGNWEKKKVWAYNEFSRRLFFIYELILKIPFFLFFKIWVIFRIFLAFRGSLRANTVVFELFISIYPRTYPGYKYLVTANQRRRFINPIFYGIYKFSP